NRERLAPWERGVEGRIERAAAVQRKKSIGARAEEIVLECPAWVHLVQIDAAPQSASEHPDVARLAGELPGQLVRHADAELVHLRLLDVGIVRERRRSREDVKPVGIRGL